MTRLFTTLRRIAYALVGPALIAGGVLLGALWLGPLAQEELTERAHMRKVQRDAEAHARAQLAFDQRMQAKCGGENASYRYRAKNEFQCLNKQGRVTITVKD